MRSFNIFISLIGINIKKSLEYPVKFLIEFITTIITFLFEFSTIYLFMSKIGHLNGWNSNELAIMYIFTIFSGALELLFTTDIRLLSMQIINGDFDTKLIRPIHPLLILFSNMKTGVIATILFCIGGSYFILSKSPQYWSFYNLLWFLVSIIGGALIFISLNIISSGIGFWTYDSESFYKMTKIGTRQLIWYPLDIYNKIIKFSLIFILPLGFVGYFPSQIITNKTVLDLPQFIKFMGLPVGIGFFIISVMFWNLGLKKYEGAGN